MTYHKKFVTAIKSKGKILKEFDNNQVLLPFSSEYSILLKNLNSRKASVQISIDGVDVLSQSSLILDANSEVELERFLEDNDEKGHRFKFIKKTDKISNHRGDRIDDGIIRIEYRFEREPLNLPLPSFITYPANVRSVPLNFYSNYNVTSANNISAFNCSTNTFGGSTNNITFTSTLVEPEKIEAGITVPGSISNQEFKLGNIGALEDEAYVITYLLRGTLKDNSEVKLLVMSKTKDKCPTCGKRNKGKFCSNCGTNLEII